MLRSDSGKWVVRAEGAAAVVAGGLAGIKPADGAAGGDEGAGKKPVTMKKVNRALANLLKSDLPKAITDQVKPLLEELKQSLAAGAGAVGAAGGSGDGGAAAAAASGHAAGVADPVLKAELISTQRQLQELTNQIKTETDSRKAAEVKNAQLELHGAVDKELSKYVFKKAEGQEAAKRLILADVQRDETGQLVAGGLLLPDFVKNQLTTTHDYFLAPAQVSSGTGAAAAGAGSGVRAGAVVGQAQFESIKQGMTEAETMDASKAILAALSAHQAGG